MLRLVFLLAVFSLARCAAAVPDVTPDAPPGNPAVLDDFSDPARWKIITSEGVTLHTSTVEGLHGKALRLEYDFGGGAGYCIIQRKIDLPLPANYRFDLFVRGQGPANNLEFKLVDPSGDNVWWVNRRAFEPPAQWTPLRNRKRHFEFAWGPSGGKPMTRLGAIEFAISAAEGGRGRIDLDELTFEPLPDVDPTPVGGYAIARMGRVASSFGPLAPDGAIPWSMAGLKTEEWAGSIEVRFDHTVEFGAVEVEVTPGVAFTLQSQQRQQGWRDLEIAASDTYDPGGSWAYFCPESEAIAVRVLMASGRRAGAVRRLRLVPVDEVPDANAFWATRARAADRGLFPPYFLGERSAWTVVGLPDDDNEALISEYGAVEPFKGGWSIEPFLVLDGRLVTWADADVSRSLDAGHLPIPTVSWNVDGLGLDITALATGDPGASRLLIRYRVTNPGDEPRGCTLVLATRPFQVLPAYQRLNIIGGVSEADPPPISDPDANADANADDNPDENPDADALRGLPVPHRSARRLTIPPGASRDVVVSMPMHEKPGSVVIIPADEFASALHAERQRWAGLLDRPGLTLPDSQRRLVDTLRTAIADILINQDGPAIQPGSRTYERSWIRDGSVTSLALIHAGLADHARAFIDWYARYQFDTGKVPCVVDRRGPDPVDEHDSTGEFIFALRNAAIATGDTGLLREHYENVVKGVQYMESLRAQRLGDDYAQSDDPVRRACIGLMPESISHEGYSAKPMHSYWDDFWALRGYEDAADIARRLGKTGDAARFAKIARDFRDDLFESIRLAAEMHDIDYTPGCVELGDFDATSTSIAVAPLGLLDRAPEPLLTNTFEKYWSFFKARRDGAEPWEAMTPYELRIVDAFVRLGWSGRAHEVLDWMFERQSPPGWNQWAEVAYADPDRADFVGDMPHTWVASGYVLSLMSLFGYEKGDTVVLAPGVPIDWVFTPEGVGVDKLWTHHGPLSYRYKGEAGRATLEILDAPDAAGGFVLRLPSNAAGDIRVDGKPHPTPREGLLRLDRTVKTVSFRVDRTD